MKLLCDLFGQLYEVRVFSELVHDRVIFQKEVSGFSTVILYSWLYLSEWSMPGIQNSQLSAFSIMLSTIRVSFIFSILAYARRAIKYAVRLEFYCKVVSSVSIIRHCSKIYTAKSAEDDYCSANLRALPIVLHILIGINSRPCPPCVQFTPYRNCEDVIFCKVDGL